MGAIRGHALEPWAQRRAFLDAVEIPPGTKQRLLHRVLGVRQGAEHVFDQNIVFSFNDVFGMA